MFLYQQHYVQRVHLVVSGKLKQEETKNFKFYQAYHHKNGQEIEIELLQNIVSFLNHAAP